MHSTPATLTPESESNEQPGTLPDRTNRRRPNSRRGWMAVAGFVVVLGIILAIVTRHSNAPVTRGPRALSSGTTPGQILRLKGTTEAVQSRAILAPLLAGQSVPTLTIIHLAPAGTRVKQGRSAGGV